jgi:hypothetical protein
MVTRGVGFERGSSWKCQLTLEMPVPVDVRLPTILRPAAGGQATVEAEGATVGEVFDDLIRQHPGLETSCSRPTASCTATSTSSSTTTTSATSASSTPRSATRHADADARRRRRVSRMARYESVLDLIGNTPMVDISQLSPNPRVASWPSSKGGTRAGRSRTGPPRP